MQLVNLQGLNCYHNCIISIANHFQVDYAASFANLWSEYDFRFDPHRQVYLTRRMITDLEYLGAKLEKLPCDSETETRGSYKQICENEFFIVGMDAFYIPWNQFYQTFHGPHYFFALSKKAETLCCFDPTYYKQEQQILCDDILRHAFDISCVHRVEKSMLNENHTVNYLADAGRILDTLPTQCRQFLVQLENSREQGQEYTQKLAKHVDTMLSNRHLFRYYLQQCQVPSERIRLYMESDFLMRWYAVKNGLYKASLGISKPELFDEIRKQFQSLVEEELKMAEQMAMKPVPV